MSTAQTSPESFSNESLLGSEKPLSTRAAIVCLLIFIAAYETNAMDRQVFPMMLPWIAKTYHFDLKTAGSLSTIFTLGLCIAGIPTGYLIDRWNRKTTLLIGMVIYSLATLATIFAIGFADMLFYRATLGFGEAMQQAVLFAASSSFFYKNKAMVTGTIQVGFGIGGAVAPYLATLMVVKTNNWHIPFICFCFIGLFMAFIVWWAVPKTFTENKGPIDKGKAAELTVSNIPEKFWNRNSILCTISIPFTGCMMFGYMGLYPMFLIRELHFAPKIAAAAVSIYGIGCMFGILGGWIGDRFSTRWTIFGSYCAVIGTTYLLFNVATLPWEHNVLSFLQGLIASSTLYPNNCALLQKSVRPQMIGRATGLFQVCHYAGGTVAGFLFGWLITKLGWHTASLIQESMFPIMGLIAMCLIKENQLFSHKKPKVLATAV
jgi:MFS family permease